MCYETFSSISSKGLHEDVNITKQYIVYFLLFIFNICIHGCILKVFFHDLILYTLSWYLCYIDKLFIYSSVDIYIYTHTYIYTKIDQMNINTVFILCRCIHVTFIYTLKQCHNKYSCMFLVSIGVLLEWMSGFYHMIPLQFD